MRKITKNKTKALLSTNQGAKRCKPLVIPLVIIIIMVAATLDSNNLAVPTVAATQKEAFDAITTAFEKVTQASRYGLVVTNYTARLNDALTDYENGDYDTALTKANNVYAEVDEILAEYQWGRILPYILIPVNIILVFAIVVFFGRNILQWFQGKSDEEFMDLEIIYEEPEVTIVDEDLEKAK